MHKPRNTTIGIKKNKDKYKSSSIEKSLLFPHLKYYLQILQQQKIRQKVVKIVTNECPTTFIFALKALWFLHKNSISKYCCTALSTSSLFVSICNHSLNL